MRILIYSITILLVLIYFDYHSASSNIEIIEVYPKEIIGEVNKLVFGHHIMGYDPWSLHGNRMVLEKDIYSNYGAGIWNPQYNKSNEEVIQLAKDIGMPIIRFPGGQGSTFYNWKKTIGNREKRPDFQFGLDEFLSICEQIGAEAFIVLSYFVGTEQDAADLVEYLNTPNDGNNPGKGIDWARIRASNGHNRPYNVKYFEFGNDVMVVEKYVGRQVDGKEYAQKYNRYSTAMKAIDPTIKIGVLGWAGVKEYANWNYEVIDGTKGKIDFLTIFGYRPWYKSNKESIDVNRLFEDIFQSNLVDMDNNLFRRINSLLLNITGRRIPIAVTEYNGGFVQDRPVPFRFTLGNALINAELLRLFMKPESNVILSIHHHFINSYWGMIDNEDYKKVSGYIKRPNYYVYELYHKYFGKYLINSKYSSKYLSVNSSLSDDKKKTYVIVINKNLKEAINSAIEIKGLNLMDNIDIATLDGPNIASTNEIVSDTVKITYKKLIKIDNILNYTFPPHSITAFQLDIR